MDPTLDKSEGGVGLRPRFRSDLVATLAEEEGVAYVDVVDPTNGSSFRFYDFEYAIAREMDGERTLAEIAAWAQARFGFDTSPEDLTGYAGKLEELGYLLSGGPAAAGILQAGITAYDAASSDQTVRHEVPAETAAGGFEGFELGAPGASAPLVKPIEARIAHPSPVELELGPPEALERPTRERPAVVPEEIGLEHPVPVVEGPEAIDEIDSGSVVAVSATEESAELPPPLPGVSDAVPPPMPMTESDSLVRQIVHEEPLPPAEAAPAGIDPLAPTAFAISSAEVKELAAAAGSAAPTAPAASIGGEIKIKSAPEDALAMSALAAAAKKQATGVPAKAPPAKSSLLLWVLLGVGIALVLGAAFVLVVHPELVKGLTGGGQSASNGSSNGTRTSVAPRPRPVPAVRVLGTGTITTSVAATLRFQVAGVIEQLPVAGSDLAAGQVIARLVGATKLEDEAKSDRDRADTYRTLLARATAAHDAKAIARDNDHLTMHTQDAAAEQAKADSMKIVEEQNVHVVRLLAHVGANVDPSTPVADVTEAGPPVATIDLSVSPPAALKSGTPCTLRTRSDSTRSIEGTIVSIVGNRLVCGALSAPPAAGEQVDLVSKGL